MDFWTIANTIWLHGRALYLQHQRLSALAKTLPKELQLVHRRSTSLSFALYHFGELLRDNRFGVLEPDHESNKDVFNMIEQVTTALFRIIYEIQKLTVTPESGVCDTIWSYFGFSSPVETWLMKNDLLISETEEIRFTLTNINHVVTASNARQASELSDRLERLENRVWGPRSLIKLFGLRPKRQPLSIGQVDRLSADEVCRRAKACVKDLCNKDESFCWYRFLDRDTTTAVILVGEIANVNNIIAFFIWYAEDGKKTRFYKIDKMRPFRTYPGKNRNKVTVFVSKEHDSKSDQVTLRLRNPNDAYGLRELMDSYKTKFAGYVSGAKFRQDPKRRYKPLAVSQQSEGLDGTTYIAEVLDFDTPNTARVLQLWPHHGSGFTPRTDPIYVHKVPNKAIYEVEGQTLRLRGAKVTRTEDGIGYLRRQSAMNCDELKGDFEINFRTSEEAWKVYCLLLDID